MWRDRTTEKIVAENNGEGEERYIKRDVDGDVDLRLIMCSLAHGLRLGAVSMLGGELQLHIIAMTTLTFCFCRTT